MATLGIFTVKVFYRQDGIYYTNGGYGLYLEQMCLNFDRVIMLCKLHKGAPPDGFYRVEHPNLEVVTVPAWWSELGALAVQPIVFAKGMSLARRCDVIHARMPDWNGITGALVAGLRGVPRFHQIIDDWYGLAWSIPLTKAFGLGIGLRAALLFYDWCERRFSRGQMVFAQGQVSYDKHARAAERHLVLSSAHRETDIGDVRPKCTGKRIRLMAVGRLHHVKNHEVLIRALAEVRKTDPRCELRIFGEGNKRAELEALVQELSLEGVVTLPGGLEHDLLWPEYDQSDIFVLPSRSEGTPKVVLEAMARGCPVIASIVGGVPTAVEHEERGLLFASEDQAGLVAAILRMIDDEALREHCQKQAWAFSRQHTLEGSTAFMLDQVVRKWPQLAPLKSPEDIVVNA